VGIAVVVSCVHSQGRAAVECWSIRKVSEY